MTRTRGKIERDTLGSLYPEQSRRKKERRKTIIYPSIPSNQPSYLASTHYTTLPTPDTTPSARFRSRATCRKLGSSNNNTTIILAHERQRLPTSRWILLFRGIIRAPLVPTTPLISIPISRKSLSDIHHSIHSFTLRIIQPTPPLSVVCLLSPTKASHIPPTEPTSSPSFSILHQFSSSSSSSKPPPTYQQVRVPSIPASISHKLPCLSSPILYLCYGVRHTCSKPVPCARPPAAPFFTLHYLPTTDGVRDPAHAHINSDYLTRKWGAQSNLAWPAFQRCP